MDGWTIGGWIDGRTDRWAGWWMHGRWMGGQTDRQMYVCMNGWVNGWADGQMYPWTDGQTDGWMGFDWYLSIPFIRTINSCQHSFTYYYYYTLTGSFQDFLYLHSTHQPHITLLYQSNTRMRVPTPTCDQLVPTKHTHTHTHVPDRSSPTKHTHTCANQSITCTCQPLHTYRSLTRTNITHTRTYQPLLGYAYRFFGPTWRSPDHLSRSLK